MLRITSLVAEAAQRRRPALGPVEGQHPPRVGVERRDARLARAADQLRLGGPQGRDQRHAGNLAGRRRGAGRDRREAVAVADHQLALEAVVDGGGDRALDARREDGDEGDHGEADHQRRGGDRGAAGLRWVFSRARRPVSLRSRSSGLPGQRGERPHQARAEEGDAEDDRDRAAADQPRRRVRAGAAEEADQDHRQAGDAEQRGERGVGDPTPPARRHLERLQRGDRRHPGGAQRRDQRGDQRDADPDREGDDDGPRLEHQAGRRQVDPDRDEERVEPLGDREAGGEAEQRPGDADQQRLDDDRAEDLPAARRPACAASRTR